MCLLSIIKNKWTKTLETVERDSVISVCVFQFTVEVGIGQDGLLNFKSTSLFSLKLDHHHRLAVVNCSTQDPSTRNSHSLWNINSSYYEKKHSLNWYWLLMLPAMRDASCYGFKQKCPLPGSCEQRQGFGEDRYVKVFHHGSIVFSKRLMCSEAGPL